MQAAQNPLLLPALFPGLQPPLPVDAAALLLENQTLKAQVAVLQQLLAAEKAKNGAAAAAAGATTAAATAAAGGGRRKQQRRKRQEDSDEDYRASDGSDAESDGAARGTKRRSSQGRGSGAAAAAALDKQAAKEMRQRAQLFLNEAGEKMKAGMAWQRRGVTFSFCLALDSAAFQYLFGLVGADGERCKLKLSAEQALAVFDKGRCVKKYRLGSVGGVSGMTVEYQPALQRATCTCSWGVDKCIGLAGL